MEVAGKTEAWFEGAFGGWVLIAIEGDELSPAGKALDAKWGGYISTLAARGALHGTVGESLFLGAVPGHANAEVLIMKVPKGEVLDRLQYRALVAAARRAAEALGYETVYSLLSDPDATGQARILRLTQAEAESALAAGYQFDRFQAKRQAESRPAIKRWWLVRAQLEEAKAIAPVVVEAQALSRGMKLAKDLANLPANVCSPTFMAEQARALAQAYPERLTVSVLDEQDLKALNMGAYLAVSQGSHQEAQMAVLTYQGAPSTTDRPYVFVGKGLSFDSGGISLKPSEGMEEMKYDMCGAAAVLGLMQAVAELKLSLNVIGVMAGCENMPGGGATRPGDIVKTAAGLTVEILNTDAEGRLVLADALTYVARFNPEVVIDLATLTGACVVALGRHTSGLISNSAALADALVDAGARADDAACTLPMHRLYQEQIVSRVADLANSNTGARSDGAGTITAGCFLARFAEHYRWAHLDIAGTATQKGKGGGATGRPIPLLLEFLRAQAMRREV